METKFSTPQRQNIKGVFVIFLIGLTKNIKNLIYAFIPLLSARVREKYLLYIIVGLVILLIFQLFYAYKKYLNFKFHIRKDRFYLRHGVFKTTDIDISFDRIQNININQNLLQKTLNVVGFEIETAGQNDAEITIKALEHHEAIELKKTLLSQTNTVKSKENKNETKNTPQQTSKLLFRLDLFRLLKVGLSSNYFKGLGLVFVFFSSMMQFAKDIFKTSVNSSLLHQLPKTFGFIGLMTVLILITSIVVTAGNSVIKYFDLKITKSNQDFEVEYGLLKRINQVIKKNKTQVFEIEENPIKNVLNIKNVFISQASSEELNKKKKIGLVGLSHKEINTLFTNLFDLSYPQRFIYLHSKKRYILRLLSRYLLVIIMVGVILYYLVSLYTLLFVLISIILLFSFLSYAKQKKSYIGINDDIVLLHSGSIHTIKKYIAMYKIQSISISQNWFQRKNKHADIIIYTASGIERINYLNYKELLQFVNYINYKLESSTISWM